MGRFPSHHRVPICLSKSVPRPAVGQCCGFAPTVIGSFPRTWRRSSGKCASWPCSFLAASLWLPCEPLGLRDLWGSCVGRMCMPPPKSSNGQSCSADIFEAASEASRRSRFCRRCGTSALRSWWISFGPPRTAEAELEKGWVAIGERPVTPDSSKEHDGASCGGKRGLYAWGMRTYFLLLGGKMANITGLHGQTGCDCQSCLSRAVALLLFKRGSCCQDMLSYWIVLKFYSGGDVQSEIDNCRERLSSTFAF